MSAQHSTQQSEENHVYQGGSAMIVAFLFLFILVAFAAWYWLGVHPESNSVHTPTHVEATK
jgi:hypothetical protein